MISITGYYYSVLTCALEQLENMFSSTVAESVTHTESVNSNSNYTISNSPSKNQNMAATSPEKNKNKGNTKNN